jgi:hypothetical protein
MEVDNPSFLNLGSTRMIDVIDVIVELCYKTDDMPSSREILLSRVYRSSFSFGRKCVDVCCRCRS